MNVLVTGANGLLGHHVVLELLKRKHSVSIIVRTTHNICFDLSAVQVYLGDFTDYSSLNSAAEGCEAIIHSAALTATDLISYDEYRRINVLGTAQVLRVADHLNINRLVYVSSANTIGFGTEQELADERSNIEFPFSKSFYAQSKWEAEQLLSVASQQANRNYLIINPTFMIGAYDTKPSSGKLLIMGYKRKLLLIPKGGKNFVAVQDVAVAICNALTQGRNGERYLASGINISFKEYFKLQKELGGYSQYCIQLPNFVLYLLANIGDLFRSLGFRTAICSMNLQQLMIDEYYSNRKAKFELHLPETELKIAIREAIDWFLERRMIRS